METFIKVLQIIFYSIWIFIGAVIVAIIIFLSVMGPENLISEVFRASMSSDQPPENFAPSEEMQMEPGQTPQ